MTHETYRLWWECLQLVPLDDWSAKVRNDLGSAQSLPFEDWWEEVKELLQPEPPFLVRHLETKQEAKDWSAWEVEGEAVFLVNLDYPTSVLVKELERRLAALQQRRPGRPEWESLAEYPLTRMPNNRHIRTLLDVFRERVINGKKLWEVGVVLKLAPQADKKTTDGRNVLAATAGRAVKQAHRLIWNASQGSFPSY